MITVVYPLTVQLDYTELKFSLRSLEKYLPQPFEVVIVGTELPEWINNITQIELPDVRGRKQLSIKKKILAALEYAEEILFMNDDIYLLQPGIENIPYYYSGDLSIIRESGTKPLQKKLEQLGKPQKHFDIHVPIIYKQDFKQVIRELPEDTIIKSAYCNYLEIEGEEMPDCKIQKVMAAKVIKELIKDRVCFSTGPQGLKSSLPVLNELYPHKSQYEI